jgi:hypothetical protein
MIFLASLKKPGLTQAGNGSNGTGRLCRSDKNLADLGRLDMMHVLSSHKRLL